MKRFFALMLCLILTLGALFACGEETGGDGSNSAASNNTDHSSGGTDGTQASQGGSSTDTSSSIGDAGTEGDKGNETGLNYQYNMSEYITLPDYKNHKVELSFDDIQKEIDNAIMNFASKSRRTICMTGDVVRVTCFGYKMDENGEILYDEDGVPVVFAEIDSTGFYLGSGLNYGELETGIVGMKIGDIREIQVTLPTDYSIEEVAGQTVIFEVILNEIYDTAVYNNEFVSTNIPEYKNTAEYEKALKDSCTLKELYAYVVENATVKSYPKSEYDHMANELKEMESAFETQYKVTLDEYLQNTYGMTRDEYIKSEMKKEMVYYAIAQRESLEPTGVQLEAERLDQIAYYKEYYISRGASEKDALNMAKSIVADLGNAYIYENVIHDLVDTKLLSSVDVAEKQMTYTSITQVLAQREGMETGSEIGKLCPSLDLEAFDENGTLETTIDPSMNVGKLTVINFWGTWCPYCLVELPDFDRIATEYKDRLTIFAVHSTSGYETAADYVLENFQYSEIVFLKDYPINPNSEYSSDTAYTAFGGEGYYPYTVILDENGIIVAKHTGAMTYSQLLNILKENGLDVEK